MGKLLTNRNFYSVLLAVVISFAFVAIMVNGATTISTNINTGGTLTVSGASTLTGDVTTAGSVFATSTLAVTGKAFFYDQVTLLSQAANPTADATGAIFFDSDDRVIKVYDGVDWRTVASTTSSEGLVLGASRGVRFNTIATGYMALGTSTLPVTEVDSGNAILHVNATTSASVPLVIMGKGAYGGNLLNAYNYLQTEVFSIDTIGNASTTMLSTTALVADALVVSGYATTSGSTGNIQTEGTLTVTGNTTLNGAVTLGDAVGDAIIITGNATTSNAFTVRGLSFDVAGYATTTVSIADTFATTTLGGNTFGSMLGVGTSTPDIGAKLGVNGDISAGGTVGTTTLRLHAGAANTGTCIQMRTTDGAVVRIYATTTPASQTDNFFDLVIEAGLCETP
ncbi:hypothetical protein CL630_01470 [bacterium]|nr:hypothetical protein [bacterium]|tara:strand:+ start:15665 stop:16852 length:1188 start_codon:yes stop_codon:yes gene_type:complete